MKTVLVACGTAIATSTVVAKKIEKICSSEGIEVKTVQCKAVDALEKTDEFKPDIIVGTCDLPGEFKVPLIDGRPFLTNVNLDECIDELLEILKNN